MSGVALQLWVEPARRLVKLVVKSDKMKMSFRSLTWGNVYSPAISQQAWTVLTEIPNQRREGRMSSGAVVGYGVFRPCQEAYGSLKGP